MIPVGFTLQPDLEFLDLLGGVVRDHADYYEVAPETLWREDAAGQLLPNGFHRRFAALAARGGSRFFVAHGVGLSVGSAAPGDGPRRRRWQRRIAEDQRIFHFRWYTDHLGVTSAAGENLTLPVALPMTPGAAALVRRRLVALQRLVPDVGVENTVACYLLGDPLTEPAFLARCLAGPRLHLLLDLHNLYTMALNFGFDPEVYLDRLPLQRVIELHLSGGADSDPAWLPSRRVLRLDAHDRAIPDPVWWLFARVAPRCPNLRGVTIERMEGSVTVDDVGVLRGELRRAKRILRRGQAGGRV